MVWVGGSLFWSSFGFEPVRTRRKAMRATWILVCSFLVLGCGQPTIEERATRNEKDIKSLLNGAKTIRADLVKSKEECLEKVTQCDLMLVKLDTLLNIKPQPVTPPAPIPVTPSLPSPAPTPATPPGPQPPAPSPLPPLPVAPVGPVDGRFGVATAVWKIVQAVESPDRDEEAKALAGVFSSVAMQVREKKLEGTLLDPQWHRISVALTAGNKPVIAKHLEAWDGPANQLSKKIAIFYKEGKLKSDLDWADLLDEIALGLKWRSK